jgi:hypothetical protein
MKLSLLTTALLLAASGSLAAQPRPVIDRYAPAADFVGALEASVPGWGYYIELSDLIYVTFLTRTNDTSSPIQINDVTIRFDDDDNPQAFDRVLP